MTAWFYRGQNPKKEASPVSCCGGCSSKSNNLVNTYTPNIVRWNRSEKTTNMNGPEIKVRRNKPRMENRDINVNWSLISPRGISAPSLLTMFRQTRRLKENERPSENKRERNWHRFTQNTEFEVVWSLRAARLSSLDVLCRLNAGTLRESAALQVIPHFPKCVPKTSD